MHEFFKEKILLNLNIYYFTKDFFKRTFVFNKNLIESAKKLIHYLKLEFNEILMIVLISCHRT
jgi:hypothetical protein